MTAGVYDPEPLPPQQDPDGPVSVPDPDLEPDPFDPEPLVNPDEPTE